MSLHLTPSDRSDQKRHLEQECISHVLRFWKIRPEELYLYPEFGSTVGCHDVQQVLRGISAALGNITDDRVTPILLYGPPVGDKTMIAGSCFKIKGVTSFSVCSSWLKENPERSVEALFRAAKSSQPCVILMNNIDKLIHNDGRNLRQKHLSALVKELKTIKTNKLKILFIACINDPWSMTAEPEISQLFEQLHVPLPNGATREEIIRDYLYKSNLVTMPLSGEGIRISAAAMQGFTHEEVNEFLRSASRELLEDSVQKPVKILTFMRFGWRKFKRTSPVASSKTIEGCVAYEQYLAKSQRA